LNIKKRAENVKKFPDWEVLPDGSRIYWFDISEKLGWKARYLKRVDKNEITILFWQEIYDEKGTLVEIHEKFPEDKGHRKIKE